MLYYILDGEDALGPFGVPELLSRPGFGAESVVRLDGGGEWKPAIAFPEIEAAFGLAGLIEEDLPGPTAAAAPHAPPPPHALPPPHAPPPPPRPAPSPPAPPAPKRPPPALPPPTRNAPQPLPAARTPAGSPPPLIMIVDDEADICEIIKYHAIKAGFRAVTAYNGRDAAAKIETEPPSLIVLDLMMPGQSGYEFLRAMHASGHGTIPVSIITGRRMDSSTVAMLREEKNVVELFSKPFDVPQFIASLRRHARSRA